MKKLKRHWSVPAALAAFVLASLALAAFALADNTVADGDGLTPVNINPETSNMVFGDVSCGATTTKQALIAITRNGGTSSTNVFKDGATVTVTAHSVAGGVSATSPVAQITLPGNWGTQDNNTLSSTVVSTVSINPSAEGSGSGSVTYRATGLNRSNVTITRDDVMSVSWHAGPCTPPDTTPPSSSASAADSDGETYAFGDWSRKDVTVALSAHDNDGGSGLKEIRYTLDGSTPGPGQGSVYGQPFTIHAEGVTSLKWVAIDEKDNVESPVHSEVIRIDKTAPSVSLRAAGNSCDAPGENGWCRGEQTAGFHAEDGGSGLAVGGAAHDFTTSTTENGGAVMISSGTVKDNAGNEAVAIDAGPFKIDSVEPAITGSASPAPSLAGWNDGDVHVKFECSDPDGSGVASCGPDQTLEGEGRGQSVTGNATDEAGNGASTTVSGIHIDRTAPSAPLASFDKAKAYTDGDGNDWYKDSVTVSFGGSSDPELDDDRADVADKSGSGVKGYSPDAARITTGTLSYSGTATDNADNESDAVSGAVEVDADDPLLQTSGCPTAAVVLGTPQALSVSASDGESGLATDGDPSGTLPLDTSTVGSKSVTVEAKDNVGHVVESTCSYRVIWDFTGFLAPIDNPVTGKMNGVKAGSSVPVKFKLGGYQGMDVLVASYPKSTEFPCGTTPVDVVPDEAALFAASSSGLSYDLVSDQYSYVWKTDKLWAGKCRQLVLKFTDGESRFVNFKAMK